MRLRSTIIAVIGVSVLLGVPAPAGAQQGLSHASWQPGPSSSGDNSYVGGVDTPSSGAGLGIDRLARLSGWFVDSSAQGWSGADDLVVYTGTMDSGTSLGHGNVGLPRADVASSLNNPYWSASGWSAVIDPGGMPLGQNTLSIYLHTPSKGWWFTQLVVTVGAGSGSVSGPLQAGGAPIVTVAAPVDGERVSTRLGNYRVTGTVRDPIAGSKAIDRVQVWLNGERNTEQASYIGDADVASDGSWGIDFGPSHYPGITSNMYVYAHSDVTNKTTLVVVHFELVDRP
jgi:hypothetical protein